MRGLELGKLAQQNRLCLGQALRGHTGPHVICDSCWVGIDLGYIRGLLRFKTGPPRFQCGG